MNKYKIGICGHLGVVGSAVFEGLRRLGHEVKGHDLRAGTQLKDLLDSQVIFICVPTPAREDYHCDTSIVEKVVDELNELKYTGILAIKSTVKPGTCKRLREKYVGDLDKLSLNVVDGFEELLFVPEFLRERSAFYDFTEGHDTLIIGDDLGDKHLGAKTRAARLIEEIHGRYPKQVRYVSLTEAELIKYYSNVFNALRVTWANGFYDICQKMGASYDKVKDAVISRGTINDLYLDCNENMRGFSGPCLPKESKALMALSEELGVPAKIFRTIVEDNNLYKKTVWEGMRADE